ncbi:HFL132Cp [Eremothecium sinecaudum]|uniref:HFL132Cp n=1 Tax=Eremothecium sinecaudum TaxID=45286 RepID=A0A0X8HUI9_9SACH|nr:HFL132Cp [Eremothecium sinecaudum]AMD21724.1 HFL132Cp [Eremothecium sinecaudum]
MANFGRRTWDREEYAKLAKESRPLSHLEDLSEAQFQQLKLKYTNYEKLLQESTADADKRIITSALTSYKRGKQFGFYCELCNLTFKDTLQYIDHLNHKVHEIKFEQVFDEKLVIDTRDNEHVPISEFVNEYKSQVAAFAKNNGSFKATNRKPKKYIKVDVKKKEKDNETTDEVSDAMGFKSFGSTKRK